MRLTFGIPKEDKPIKGLEKHLFPVITIKAAPVEGGKTFRFRINEAGMVEMKLTSASFVAFSFPKDGFVYIAKITDVNVPDKAKCKISANGEFASKAYHVYLSGEFKLDTSTNRDFALEPVKEEGSGEVYYRLIDIPEIEETEETIEEKAPKTIEEAISHLENQSKAPAGEPITSA